MTDQTYIRGFPRDTENIKLVQDILGGKLVTDQEPDVLYKLDRWLFKARKELGHYPDYMVLPDEPFSMFIPVPFDINFMGLTFQMYDKPAWFRIPKRVSVPSLPWK